MVRRFKSFEAYQRALVARPDELLRYNVSPGWALAALGVHRSRIHQMVEDGVLDAIRTDDGFVFLSRAEITAYRRLRNLGPRRDHEAVGRRWMAAKRERQARSLDFKEGVPQTA